MISPEKNQGLSFPGLRSFVLAFRTPSNMATNGPTMSETVCMEDTLYLFFCINKLEDIASC